MRSVQHFIMAIISVRFILLILILPLSACSSVYFYPRDNLIRQPADMQLEFHDVLIQSQDNKTLHGWYLPAQQLVTEPKGTVFFSAW